MACISVAALRWGSMRFIGSVQCGCAGPPFAEAGLARQVGPTNCDLGDRTRSQVGGGNRRRDHRKPVPLGIQASPPPRGRDFAIFRHSSGASGEVCAGTSGGSQRCRRAAGGIPVIACSWFPQGWKSIRNAEPDERAPGNAVTPSMT